MKNRIETSQEWYDSMVDLLPKVDDNVLLILHNRQNGWMCCDMTCTTKSAKVAINRFFKAVPELSEWKSMIKDAVENGCYGAMGTLDYGEKDFSWGIVTDNVCGDKPTVYIYLNVREEG